MKVLGVIPARGGSQGVKRKNIRLLGDKPLLQWSVDAAKESRLARVVGSTEDAEIAETFKKVGCEVIDRPENLALEDTPIIPVLHHVLDALAERGEEYTHLLLLQPTAPFRSAEDINTALDMLEAQDIESLVSVYQVEDAHPARMYKMSEGRLQPLMDEPKSRRRQDLEPVYHRNGAIYACTTRLLREESTLLEAAPVPMVMPHSRSANIDTELDLSFAEFLVQQGEVG